MPLFRPRPRRLTEGSGHARFRGPPRAITRSVLDSALACGASAYPNEFGGVLRSDEPGVITDLLLIPGTTSGKRHANFQLYMLPVDLGVVGTVHSHPSGALHPSQADVTLFRHWGQRHLILGRPFTAHSWRAYDNLGRPISLEVVERPGPPPTLEMVHGPRGPPPGGEPATPQAAGPGSGEA